MHLFQNASIQDIQIQCEEYFNHLLGLTLSTPGLVDNFFLGQNQFLQFSKGVLFLPSQRVKPTFTLESLALQRDQTFSNFWLKLLVQAIGTLKTMTKSGYQSEVDQYSLQLCLYVWIFFPINKHPYLAPFLWYQD